MSCSYEIYRKFVSGSLNTASKFAKPLTRSLAAINLVATGTAVINDLNKGEFKSAGARVIVASAAAGFALIPVVGWGLALGLGLADALWGDSFYEMIQKSK